MSFVEIIRWPFAQLIRIFYDFSGNYAIALLLFALAIKIVLLPLSVKQQKSQIRMAKLKPKMAAIEKKYAGRNDQKTQRKKQEELMELQQKEGYSPLSGCLPLLIQLPLIIILYQIILRPLTYICQIGEDVIASIKTVLTPLAEEGTDLAKIGEIGLMNLVRDHAGAVAAGEGVGQSVVDQITSMNLNLFGLDLTVTPSLKAISWLVLIPVLTFATSIISMKLSRKFMGAANLQAASPENKTSNIIMDYMMPAMSLYIAFTVPAAVGLYWIYQTVLGMGQQYLLSLAMPLPTFTPEEIREIERAEKEREKERRAAAMQSKKSRFEEDDDDSDGDNLPTVHSKYGDDD